MLIGTTLKEKKKRKTILIFVSIDEEELSTLRKDIKKALAKSYPSKVSKILKEINSLI